MTYHGYMANLLANCCLFLEFVLVFFSPVGSSVQLWVETLISVFSDDSIVTFQTRGMENYRHIDTSDTLSL